MGARIGLWDGLMLDWLAELTTSIPDISFSAEIGFEPDLMQGLIDGRIDIGVMYAPQRRPGMELARIAEERLVLVRSARAAPHEGAYVYVNWGPEFYSQHSASFPDLPGPHLSVNVGWLALQHILDHGGSAYLPSRQVRHLVADGRLEEVPGAPAFVLPIWAVYPHDRDTKLIDPMIEALAGRAAATV
nr:substrate-binding domain-containing protein [Thermohalobaculum xanthum]